VDQSLFQKLKDIFNTIEGWAVALSLIWLGVAKWQGWPVSVDTGAGIISPAAMLTIAAPVVLAKLGWQRPFQPAKAADVSTKVDAADNSVANKTVAMWMLGLALAVLLIPMPASAQMNYPPLDMHRANFGISGGVRALGSDAAYLVNYPGKPLDYDGEIGGQFAYSTGPAIALVIGSDWGVGSKVGSVGEGVSWALSTDGQGGGIQLFARVRAVQYFGDHVDRIIGHRSSVDFALPISWRVARNPSGKTAWYIGLIPVVDLKNPYRNSIVARLQLGWTPSPPQ
jgi:hypothetical protein